MKNQVLSIEQMRHLEKLGVDTSKASMVWIKPRPNNDDYILTIHTLGCYEYKSPIPTFTLQDMLEMIADISDWSKIKITHEGDDGWCFGIFGGIQYINNYQTNLLDLTYQALCWLAENNYIGGKK